MSNNPKFTPRINPQNPFSYLSNKRGKRPFNRAHAGARYRKRYIAQLPANIHGACYYCGELYQKVRPTPGLLATTLPLCKRCGNYSVIEFPKALLPWTFSTDRDDFAFVCLDCAKNYGSYVLFGSSCKHPAHNGGRGWECRLCCHMNTSDTLPLPVQPTMRVAREPDYIGHFTELESAYNRSWEPSELDTIQRAMHRTRSGTRGGRE